MSWIDAMAEGQTAEQVQNEKWFTVLNQQLAALADGLRVRHEQSTAQFLAICKRINDAEAAISEQIRLLGLRAGAIHEQVLAIEEKLGKLASKQDEIFQNALSWAAVPIELNKPKRAKPKPTNRKKRTKTS